MSLIIKRRRARIGINIVPLVDVLIVLVFFFLVTMQFKNDNILQITPPKVESSGKDDSQQVMIVGIRTDGTFLVDEKEVNADDLVQALTLAGKLNPEQSLLIVADESSALKYTTTVMDASKKAGFEKIRLQVR